MNENSSCSSILRFGLSHHSSTYRALILWVEDSTSANERCSWSVGFSCTSKVLIPMMLTRQGLWIESWRPTESTWVCRDCWVSSTSRRSIPTRRRDWRRVERGRLIESPTPIPGSGHRLSCLVSKASSSRRGRAWPWSRSRARDRRGALTGSRDERRDRAEEEVGENSLAESQSNDRNWASRFATLLLGL